MDGNPGRKDLLSAFVFIIFMAAAYLMSLSHLRIAISDLETPAAEALLHGKWPPQFEESFRKALPVNSSSRDLWGRLEYAVFHQGRKGVVVGSGGWLFTDEEFSCPPKSAERFAENIAFVRDTKKALEKKSVQLAVVLIPAKSRVLSEFLNGNDLPSCRAVLYTDARAALLKAGVVVTDLLPYMQASPAQQSLYLKADTHWSPAGAQLAARAVATLAHAEFRDMDLPPGRFSAQSGAEKAHTGDLASYIPGVALPPEHFFSYVSGVSVASSDAPQSLFDDVFPSVALVGTSYSANANWNFEGFLKESLKTDVLNAADQGLGPFVVMDRYLQNAAWKETPPRLVVWEVPERYLLMPHDITGGAK